MSETLEKVSFAYVITLLWSVRPSIKSASTSVPSGKDRKVGQKKRIPFNPTFVSGKERVYLTPIRKTRTGLVESRIRSVGSGN